MTDHMLRVDDLDRMVQHDVAGRYHALALARKRKRDLFTGMLTNRHTLEVEQHVNDVLLQPFQGGVFVQHAIDFDLDDGAAGD